MSEVLPPFERLLAFLTQLENASLHYDLAHNREDTIMATVAVPGERWEIEFFGNGEVEVEIFRSTGDILGGEVFERLFSENAT